MSSESSEEISIPRFAPNFRIEASQALDLDFSTKAFEKVFKFDGPQNNSTPLVQDCFDIFESGTSFFLPMTAEPRFGLEHLAKRIFDFHTKKVRKSTIDPTCSGVEWWIQVRQDPKAEIPGVPKQTQENIGFHFDKDEDLADLGVQVFPLISTVTYLTDEGSPTVVLELPGTNSYGELPSCSVPRAYISEPAQGKHFAFDGRYLHGAITDLTKTPAGYLRLTFLANIWLNYQPIGLVSYPEEYAAKQRLAVDSFQVDWSRPRPLEILKPCEQWREFRSLFGPTGRDFSLRFSLPAECIPFRGGGTTWVVNFPAQLSPRLEARKRRKANKKKPSKRVAVAK